MFLDRVILELTKFASQDQSRLALTAVNLRKEYAEATDGHILARVEMPQADPEDFPQITNGRTIATDNGGARLVPADFLNKVAKALPKKSTLPILTMAPVLEEDDDRERFVSVAVTDLENMQIMTTRPAEGTYPTTDQVVKGLPRSTDREIYLDPELVRDVAAWLVRHKASNQVRWCIPKEPTRPVTVQAKLADGRRADFVIMPLRGPDQAKDPQARPAFLGTAPSTPEPAPAPEPETDGQDAGADDQYEEDPDEVKPCALCGEPGCLADCLGDTATADQAPGTDDQVPGTDDQVPPPATVGEAWRVVDPLTGGTLRRFPGHE